MPDAAAAAERLSDVETASSSTGAPNSSLSSASSSLSLPRCSSLSRLSFDYCSPSAALAAAAAACSPLPPLRRPHRSGDAAWAAIRAAAAQAPTLGPKDFKLVRRIGGGDIGTVYLCQLLRTTTTTAAGPPSSPCLYAMKVVDRRLVAEKRKLRRAETERRVLRLLDHPFLPTLFADFDAAPHLSCVVTEFCPGGDLHTLRHRMPARRFPLPMARFYAAEVLVALEYLHVVAGVVYRDLKPENVLVRADGHVMLTDFDLALESAASSVLLVDDDEPADATASAASCFPDRLLLPWFKRRRRTRVQHDHRPPPAGPAFVVDARSRSFVGTHEYVAPEVARGEAHGAAVDWWALGVFLYELLYGRSPFAGADNERTLRNIVRRPLAFPPAPPGSGSDDEAAARDLIAGLLAKDPAARLGSRRGAADVKAHPFFRGVNFALLRSARPAFVPVSHVRRSQSCKAAAPAASTTKDGGFDLQVHRSQSCKVAAPLSSKTITAVKDAGFDLFF